ncbi:MAG: GAF domain-containing protein [Anaerolineae bacterium]|nr:GAF domain-containing protein [Anaerolineae bacterium]
MAAEKVLVVDDAQGVIDFLSDYVLRPHGYEVFSALDGEGGLTLALRENPDLVILDLEMPRMSGMEVLEALKDRGIDIPVIVITFHGSETIAAQAFRLGVKNYITKPFKMEEILEAVERALEESRLRRERAELVKRLSLANKELERRIKEFNILHGIGQAMNSLSNLEELLRRAVEAAVYLTGAGEGVVHLLDEPGGRLLVGAAQSATESSDIVDELDEAMLWEVIGSGKATGVESKRGGETEATDSERQPGELLVVPLRIRGDALGTLTVASSASGRMFSNNDRYLLSVLADYLAIGVENSRFYERVQRRAEELRLLNDVGQALSSILNLEEALTLVMERVNSMLKVEAGSLLLVDEESEELVFQIALGERGAEIKPLRVKMGQGIVGRVAQTGRPLLVRELDRESARDNAIEISTDFLAKSVLCVPMISRGKTIGVIEVINKLGESFTQDDQSLLSSIASYAAVAIENARLFRRYESSSAS